VNLCVEDGALVVTVTTTVIVAPTTRAVPGCPVSSRRVAAFAGTTKIVSPPGGSAVIRGVIPLDCETSSSAQVVVPAQVGGLT